MKKDYIGFYTREWKLLFRGRQPWPGSGCPGSVKTESDTDKA